MIQIQFVITDSANNVLVFETLINCITFFFEVGGALWSVLGVIRLASCLHEKNAPGLQSALWQISGGFSIIIAAFLFRNLILIPKPLLKDYLKFIINLISFGSKIIIFAGALWTLFGVINLAESLRNPNAPALESSLWQIVGGFCMCFAAFILNSNIVTLI